MSTTTEDVHLCHWTGCTIKVPPRLWGCGYHWSRLPTTIRRKILCAYVAGQEIRKDPSREYVLAAMEAKDWIAKHQ